MYHFPNKSIVQNGYQQFFGAAVTEPVISTQGRSDAVPHGVLNSQAPADPPESETVQARSNVKSKGGKKEAAAEGKNKKGLVDTSSFTVEQRVVAAAWVHERHYTHTSIGQIKQQFVVRFGRPAPAKNTLLVWEQKLFSSGSVHDAPRTGRPAKRKLLAGEVSASLRAAPALSVRARAAALRVPCSTLRALMRRDLPGAPTPAKPVKQKSQRALRAAPPARTDPVPPHVLPSMHLQDAD